MNTLIVYESMFGNTRRLAEAMADVLRTGGDDVTVTHAHAAPSDLSDYALVIIGAPTHAHTLPRPESRTEAANWAADPDKMLVLDPAAGSSGVREWLNRLLLAGNPRFAVFSTRVDIPRIFGGDAATAIVKRLRRRGAEVDSRTDFLVDKGSLLVEGEEQRAREWVAELLGVTTL